MNVRALVAEAVGTFTLVGIGSLGVASAVTITNNQVDLLIIDLIVPWAFAFGLLAAIAIGGHASGGHYNPAVTLAAVVDGRIDWVSGIGYAVAQLIGAFAASLGLLLVSSSAIVKATVTAPGPIGAGVQAQELRAFGIELVLTAIFVAVILTVTRKQPSLAVVVIPLTLLAIHFASVPLSGASVNPIRSLAPAVVSGTYQGLWIYVTAPFIGALIGWGIYRVLTPPDDEVSVEGEEEEYFEDDFDELAEEGEATA
jgi:MIP family channel proteins